MRGDFHVHSHYSLDSLNHPKILVKLAKRRGLDVIAVTDHNTIRGGVAAKKSATDMKDFTVIVGSEILTDIGDIIGLNLCEEIRSRRYDEVIDEIHNQGGVAVLPHPYRGHKNIDDVSLKVDFIEVWNARNNSLQNERALELAKSLNAKMIAGSDSHMAREIGNVAWSFSHDLLCDAFDKHSMNFATSDHRLKYANRFDELCSIGVRRLRKKLHLGVYKMT